MNSNLQKAVSLLKEKEYTLVLCGDGKVYASNERGVKPLIKLLDEKTDVKGFSAADKVVGKAAAFLYVLLGVSDVYAHVISRKAQTVFNANGIKTNAAAITENIINRAGNGFCPLETAVSNCESPTEALPLIRQKLKELNSAIK